MENNININSVIEDDLKINDILNLKNFNCIDNDNDNSFNQLLNLQLIIQKQSGLKEICK